MLLSMEIAGTLGFYLNGVAYPNGSTVLRTDIGEGVSALQCTTDKVTCCTNMNNEIRAGQFYYPDGTQVPISVDATSPYYRLRHSMYISLHRRSTIPTQPTGQFRCEIPDASGTTVNLFINIGMLIKINYRESVYSSDCSHYSGATANHHWSTHQYHRISYYHSTNDHHSSTSYH